jgi:hypothetical protein
MVGPPSSWSRDQGESLGRLGQRRIRLWAFVVRTDALSPCPQSCDFPLPATGSLGLSPHEQLAATARQADRHLIVLWRRSVGRRESAPGTPSRRPGRHRHHRGDRLYRLPLFRDGRVPGGRSSGRNEDGSASQLRRRAPRPHRITALERANRRRRCGARLKSLSCGLERERSLRGGSLM